MGWVGVVVDWIREEGEDSGFVYLVGRYLMNIGYVWGVRGYFVREG